MDINLTAIGLFLDIIGIVLLFINGPPISLILPDGSELVWFDDGLDIKKQNAKSAKKKICLSKIALAFIFIGFLCQFIGSIN